jgi:hypothetical protein
VLVEEVGLGLETEQETKVMVEAVEEELIQEVSFL